jgi:antitoxin PrlF
MLVGRDVVMLALLQEVQDVERRHGAELPWQDLVTLHGANMPTALTSKGQVTIPKHIRDALKLLPGAVLEFSVNAAGDVVLHPARPIKGKPAPVKDRFDAVRGSADIHWKTDDLMKLLRSDV